MLALGIDPGIARCGYGIVKREGNIVMCVDYGCIETKKELPEAVRLQQIYAELKAMMGRHKIERAGLEKLFFARNTSTALRVAQARGVVMLALQEAGIEPLELTPNEVKQGVTGYGAAEKKQMQEMMKATLKLAELPQPDDAADALAIAITAAFYSKISAK